MDAGGAVMDAGRAVILARVAAGCGGRWRCPEGKVFEEGACAPDEAGEPLAAPEVGRPAPGTSWQWQLTGEVRAEEAPPARRADRVLFEAPRATIAALREAGSPPTTASWPTRRARAGAPAG